MSLGADGVLIAGGAPVNEMGFLLSAAPRGERAGVVWLEGVRGAGAAERTFRSFKSASLKSDILSMHTSAPENPVLPGV